jgi:hypothetical protein
MNYEVNALAICIQARVPVFLWGEPGIGKTKTIEAIVAALGEKCWPVILSIREPQDQGGLPVLRPDGSVWMAPPKWAAELVAEGRGAVFLDELNVAAPTVQNSGLRVVNEGWAGDLKLPQASSFVGAGNPPETNPGAYNVTPAMANRFCHLDFPLDVEAWCNGSLAGWPTPHVRRLLPTWERGEPATTALIVNFIRVRQELLMVKPEDSQDAGKAWPSPRTWTTAARLLAAAQGGGHSLRDRESFLLVQGCVGEAAAREFMTWVVNLDLRPTEEYLADPHNTPLPTRQDQLMATLDGVAAAAVSMSRSTAERIKRCRAAWVVVARSCETSPDLSIPAARILCQNMPPEMDEDLPQEVLALDPLLQKAGINFARRG